MQIKKILKQVYGQDDAKISRVKNNMEYLENAYYKRIISDLAAKIGFFVQEIQKILPEAV